MTHLKKIPNIDIFVLPLQSLLTWEQIIRFQWNLVYTYIFLIVQMSLLAGQIHSNISCALVGTSWSGFFNQTWEKQSSESIILIKFGIHVHFCDTPNEITHRYAFISDLYITNIECWEDDLLNTVAVIEFWLFSNFFLLFYWYIFF